MLIWKTRHYLISTNQNETLQQREVSYPYWSTLLRLTLFFQIEFHGHWQEIDAMHRKWQNLKAEKKTDSLREVSCCSLKEKLHLCLLLEMYFTGCWYKKLLFEFIWCFKCINKWVKPISAIYCIDVFSELHYERTSSSIVRFRLLRSKLNICICSSTFFLCLSLSTHHQRQSFAGEEQVKPWGEQIIGFQFPDEWLFRI